MLVVLVYETFISKRLQIFIADIVTRFVVLAAYQETQQFLRVKIDLVKTLGSRYDREEPQAPRKIGVIVFFEKLSVP